MIDSKGSEWSKLILTIGMIEIIAELCISFKA